MCNLYACGTLADINIRDSDPKSAALFVLHYPCNSGCGESWKQIFFLIKRQKKRRGAWGGGSEGVLGEADGQGGGGV